MKTIAITDYGMGNLMSVQKACEYVGAKAYITGEEEGLEKADLVILPGVGAFPDAMKLLKHTGLDNVIKTQAAKKPLLGICLGMQLLFDSSDEFALTEGLGLIKGDVRKMDAGGLKIPHMGWNSLEMNGDCPLLKGVDKGSYVYFVHSYKAHVAMRDDLYAFTQYGGEVAAVVGHGNVYGCQFHPEKSSQTGLQIIKNFIEL